jgi:hypothetical protein
VRTRLRKIELPFCFFDAGLSECECDAGGEDRGNPPVPARSLIRNKIEKSKGIPGGAAEDSDPQSGLTDS